MRVRDFLLCGAAIFASSMVSDRAIAQEASADAETSDSASRSTEIIVTAQRREERIQDVPISITAVTSEDISRRGLVNAEDYLRGMPGVNYVEGGQTGGIIIRGLETNPQGTAASGRAVATYFGETPITGLQGGVDFNDIKLVDIERVEVLRGPQGTAFGDNALGGVLRIIPVEPKLDRFEGSIAAGYSITSGTGGDNNMVKGTVNVPLVPGVLAIRASAFRFSDSGFYRNVAGSDPAFLARSDTFGVRGFATDEEENGAKLATGARIAVLFQPTDDLKLTLTYLTQKTERDLPDRAGTYTAALQDQVVLGKYDHAEWRVAPQHFERGAYHGVTDSKIDLVNVTSEYDLGWGALVATGSYIEAGGTASGTIGGGNPWSGRNVHKIPYNLSGEVRLVSQLRGPFDFIVGIYGQKVKQEVFFDGYWFGSAATNPFTAITGDPSYLGAQTGEVKLNQKAIFGEVSWNILHNLTLTGGARAFKYDRTGVTVTNLLRPATATTTVSGGTSGETYKANLTYKPTENATVYASFSQGFRLGAGPQAGLPPATCDRNPTDGIVDGTNGVTIASTQFIAPDTLNNYEVGAKLSLFDRRLALSAALFRIEWKGLPFNTRAPSAAQGGCELSYFSNVGAAVSEGAEFEAEVRLTEALRVVLGASYTNAKFSEDVPTQGIQDGDRLPGSPRYNANLGLQYEFNLGGRDAFVRMDSIYVGKFTNTLVPDSRNLAGDYIKTNLSAQVSFENFAVRGFVDNLTNESKFVLREPSFSGTASGYRLRPRTFGVQLDVNF